MADGVTVGWVGVRVGVAVTVGDEVAVGGPGGVLVEVGVSGSNVKVSADVAEERMPGVKVDGAGGPERSVGSSASKIKTPIPIGIAYLRSRDSKGLSGSVNGSPA